MTDWQPPQEFSKFGDPFTLVRKGGEGNVWCIYEREFIPCYETSKRSYQYVLFRWNLGKFPDAKTGDTIEKACVPWSMWGTYGWTYGPFSKEETDEAIEKRAKCIERAESKFAEKTGTCV